jgi:hypothetical protein
LELIQQSFKVPQQHIPRAERLQQITTLLAKQGGGVKLTTKEIGEFIGMTKSPQLSGLLSELCGLDVIVCEWGKTVNGLDVRKFYIPKVG